MYPKLTVALAALALVAVPAASAVAKPDRGDRPTAVKSMSKSVDKRCKKASVAKGFVVSGVVSAPEVTSSSDKKFTGNFTLTVEKANKVARRAGWSVADAESVVLDGVRLSIEEPADATLEEGESVKLVGKVSVPRKNKKFDCGATVGEPTFKKVIFQAPAIEVEQEDQSL
ncbi:MAG TPA: hypothetical protein VGW11_08155 [Solirubrobacteraceae bacterium]|nr:hypothetical protein [Solirubrobacteraceae bacterium]